MTQQTYFDNPTQHERIKAYLIQGEDLFAVYDCKGAGTGFVGITDRRVIFYNQDTLFTKNKSMVSIPFNQIIGVASSDDGIIFKSNDITLITAAGRFSFEFRGKEKAHAAYVYIINQILNQASPQLPG